MTPAISPSAARMAVPDPVYAGNDGAVAAERTWISSGAALMTAGGASARTTATVTNVATNPPMTDQRMAEHVPSSSRASSKCAATRALVHPADQLRTRRRARRRAPRTWVTP